MSGEVICMKRGKIATSDSYVGYNVSKICITVTKWLPEAISQFVISGHKMHVYNLETIDRLIPNYRVTSHHVGLSRRLVTLA